MRISLTGLFVIILLGVFWFAGGNRVYAADPCAWSNKPVSFLNLNKYTGSTNAGYGGPFYLRRYEVSVSPEKSFHCYTSNVETTDPLIFITDKGSFQASNGYGFRQQSTAPIYYEYGRMTLPCDPDNWCADYNAFYDANRTKTEVSVSLNVANPVFTASPSSTDAEDAVIETIASKGHVSVKTDDTPLSFLATNCVFLGGADPKTFPQANGGRQPIKVVFMRGKSWNSSTAQFLGQINDVIDNGFRKFEPFSKYSGNISFYADLLKYDDSNAPTYAWFSASDGTKYFTLDFGNSLKNGSSCSTGISTDGTGSTVFGDQYIFYFNNPAIYSAYAPFNKVAYMNIAGSDTVDPFFSWLNPKTVIHEVSHTLIGLNDEYPGSLYGRSGWNTLISSDSMATNCSLSPARDFSLRDENGNIFYGRPDVVGCSGVEAATSPKGQARYWYRPAVDSIMVNQISAANPKFNVIDCGYVIAALKRERASDRGQYKKNASKYWPECYVMSQNDPYGILFENIPKSQAPTITPPPVALLPTTSGADRDTAFTGIFSVEIWKSLLAQVGGLDFSYKASPGFSITIHGSRFTQTGNAVQLINSTTGVIYEALDVPSADGNSITFAVPVTALPGNYTVRVGAFNSPWSNSLPFVVTSLKAPTLLLSANPSSSALNAQVTLSWSVDGAASCTGESDLTTTPEDFNVFNTSGTLTFTADKGHAFAASCTGPGGATRKSIAVPIDTSGAPAISLSASPTSIDAGSTATISWQTTGAASCKGAGSGDSQTKLILSKDQPTSGTVTINPTSDVLFTLVCTGPSGAISSRNVNIFVDELAVACSVTPNKPTFAQRELVTYSASVPGDPMTYKYSWSGNDGTVGNAPSVSKYYVLANPNLAEYKKVGVTVTLGKESFDAQCPMVGISGFAVTPSIPGISDPFLQLRTISPSSGPMGTTVTLDTSINIPGSGSQPATPASVFVQDVTMVVIKSGGKTMYARPTVLSNTRLQFTFRPSYPLPVASGTSYEISYQNYYSSSGLGLVASNPLTFSLPGAPSSQIATSTIRVAARVAGQPITVAANGNCQTNVIAPNRNNYGNCVREVQTTVGGTYSVKWVGGYPVGSDTTKIPTVTPQQSLTAQGTLTFYVDFAPAPVPTPLAQPVMILPWNAPQSVAAGQPFTYVLNWNGGPMDRSWSIFTHFIENDGPTIAFGDGFWPSPGTTAWKGSIQTSRTFTVPPNVPPGTYRVMAGLYDGDKRVTTIVAGSGVSVDEQYRYQVGTITVNPPGTISSPQAAISTISITSRLGGRILNATETGTQCVSTLNGPMGGNNGACRREVPVYSPGAYSVSWNGGYPIGADTSKPPVVTSAQTMTGTTPMVFYIDFLNQLSPTVTTSKSLSLTVSGSYHVGDRVPITWTSSGVSRIIIDLYNYKGLTKVRRIADVSASAGRYEWTVPPDIDFDYDNVYTIRLTDAEDQSIYRTSTKIELAPSVSAPSTQTAPSKVRSAYLETYFFTQNGLMALIKDAISSLLR